MITKPFLSRPKIAHNARFGSTESVISRRSICENRQEEIAGLAILNLAKQLLLDVRLKSNEYILDVCYLTEEFN